MNFFVPEKMAALIGVSNPELYASMREESLEDYLKTRKVPIRYSVAGGSQAHAIDAQDTAAAK